MDSGAPRAAKSRPSIENASPIHVLTQRNINGRARVRDHEGADAKPARQGPGAAHEDAVPDIERRPPVVLLDIVRVHRRTRDATGVAVSVAEGVKAK